MIFETKKYELLAALYTEKYTMFEKLTGEILKELEISDNLPEAEQKALNQINLLFKKFKNTIRLNCNSSIHAAIASIKKQMVKIVRHQVKNIYYIDYDTWRKSLNLKEEAFRIMLSNVSSFQLSSGCSNFCRRCNEWALPGVRRHFTFEAVIKLVKEIFETGNNRFSLYNASDPLDWRDKHRTIADIIETMNNQGFKFRFGLLTKVPRGSEKIIDKLLQINGDFAVSITDKNRKRIKTLERKIKKNFNVQHDMNELMIPSGLDEDFQTIKSSITDNYGIEITPDGASNIIPAFTSAINLTGQHRSPINCETDFFIKIRVGMDALPVEYFKPLNVVNLHNKEVVMSRLLDPQIENIMLDNGSDKCTPPGMMSLMEYFETFELKAISMRKKAVPAIVKRLSREILINNKNNYKYNDEKKYKAAGINFRKKVRDYLDFCRPYKIMEFKRSSFSFFLESIVNYIKKNPDTKEIILYLRKKDKNIYIKKYNFLYGKIGINLTEIVNKTEKKIFELFQMMMFKAIEDPENKEINRFIKDNPAMYDSATTRWQAVVRTMLK